jgi:hypothetical protein
MTETTQAATLELPTFKGRPGWEFTDLSKLDLTAFSPVDGGDLAAMPSGLFELDGATRLDQVDGAVSDGVTVEDGPVVLPLSVARDRAAAAGIDRARGRRRGRGVGAVPVRLRG